MKISPILIIVSLILIALFSFAFRVVTIDYNAVLPKENVSANVKNGRLLDVANQIDVKNLEASFPYRAYIDTANLHQYLSLNQDLALLDSLNPNNKEENRNVLINALTTELEKKVAPSVEHYHIDSLIMLYQWANRFNYYKDVNDENAYVYGITYEHWMNFISNKLGVYYQNIPGIKYDYKFKHLSSACRSKMFLPPTGNTSDEKIVKYLSEQKYAYLFNRFWNGTGVLVKLLFLLLFSIVIYSVYFTIKSKFKFFKR